MGSQISRKSRARSEQRRAPTGTSQPVQAVRRSIASVVERKAPAKELTGTTPDGRAPAHVSSLCSGAEDSRPSSLRPCKSEVDQTGGEEADSRYNPSRASIKLSPVEDDEVLSFDMTGTPTTVPCQYRTGKTLGSGTYAIVKEAVHIKTGKYYACKVINKKLMSGREYMVRNEIAVLKRVSSGHPNIVTLRDYFETSHNLYLVFDLCTGGELFDRICAKGNYYEQDAANLVKTIMKAVQYIHEQGIVHRDLKPENLLFRTPAEEADIMIADFGLSRVLEEEKLQLLTEICGTPGYMAPEIFKKTGHGKAVDVWAMGVITYFLLCGYTPFDRDSQQEEMEAIIAGDYKFEPVEYWTNVSTTAKSFVRTCLTPDPALRPSAEEALKHEWLAEGGGQGVTDEVSGAPRDLLPHIQRHFDARKTFRKAVLGMMAMKRMSTLAHHSPYAMELGANLKNYKEESEREIVDEDRHVIRLDHSGDDEAKNEDDIAESNPEPPTKAFAGVSIGSGKDVSLKEG